MPKKQVFWVAWTLGCVLALWGTASSENKFLIIHKGGVEPYTQVANAFRLAINMACESLNLEDSPEKISQQFAGLNSAELKGAVLIGREAIQVEKNLPPGVHVFYTMVLKESSFAGRPASGVLVSLTVQKQMESIVKYFPALKKVGMIYNPQNSAKEIEQARSQAGNLGLTLVPLAIESGQEVELALAKMTPAIVDGIWLIPDITIGQPQSISLIIKHGLEKKLIIIGFSPFHAKAGAAAAFFIDLADIGAQLADMAKAQQAGQAPVISSPRKVVVHINRNTLAGIKAQEPAPSPEIIAQ